MAIIRQIPWTQQPQDAVGINFASGASDGVRFALNGALPYFNAASGAVHGITGSGSGFSFGASSSGAVLRTPNGGAARITIAEDWAGASTIDMLVYIRSLDASYGGVFSKNAAGTSSQISLGRYDVSNTFYIGNSNTVTQFAGTSISSVMGRWACISITLSGSGASPTAAIYVDGALIESKTLSGAAQTAGAGYLVLGSERAENASFDSDTEWAFFGCASRVRSSAEIAALHNNIWQLFAPRTQRIWTAASGGAYSITAQPGSYALSGQTSTITRSRLLTGSAGSYAVTGQNATVSRSRLITASAGAYAIAGQSATLVRSRLITAQAGAYTYTGQSATITYAGAGAYTLTALAGSYALTGQTATMTKSRVINASAGSYALAGKAASITYSGAPAPTSLSGVYFDVLSGRLLVLRSGT